MATYHVREENRGSQVGDYWPLIALVGTSCLAGAAYATALGGGLMVWMHGFMGVFLLIFAVLKIFDLKGFRRGFRMYDILARQVPDYAFVYPFIELGLGLLYLSFLWPVFTYAATVIVFAFGTMVGGAITLMGWGWRDVVATEWAAMPGIVWVTLIYTAVFASAVTTVLLQFAALRLPASKVMAYTYLTPSWVILWEIGFGNGIPPALVLVGVALTAVALLLLLKDEH